MGRNSMNKKGFTSITLIVVIVAIIVSGGYFQIEFGVTK